MKRLTVWDAVLILTLVFVAIQVNASEPCKHVNYADPNLEPLKAIVKKITGERYKVWDGSKWVEVSSTDEVFHVQQKLNGRLP